MGVRPFHGLKGWQPPAISRLRSGGRYRVERELGAGGMAVVYLALDLRHDRQVALKVLRPELAAVIGAERFLREIRLTAKLQHAHILPLHDSGEADGLVFYVGRLRFTQGQLAPAAAPPSGNCGVALRLGSDLVLPRHRRSLGEARPPAPALLRRPP